MRLNKFRYYVAGLVALLVGMPLTGKAFGYSTGLGEATGNLIDMAINASSGQS